MSFFDKGVDGGLRVGSSDSSGDATPRPTSPTDRVFSQNDRLTPRPHYSQSSSGSVFHGDGGASLRQNLRQIWEDANHPTQHHQQQLQPQTSTIPHAVLPNWPNSFDHGSTSTNCRLAAPHAQARGAHARPDVHNWDVGLERLCLAESIRQHVQTPGDVPTSWPGSAYSHGVRSKGVSTAQSAAERASQPRHLSIWSTYGAQTTHDNNFARDGGITPMLSQYSAFPAAPRSTRVDAVPNRPLRARAETGFNASAESSLALRPFTSQLGPTIPIRIGQSPNSAPNNRTSSDPDPHQPPVPFYLQPRGQGFLPMHALRTGRGTFPSLSSSSSASSSGSMANHAPGVSVAKPIPSTRFSDRYHGMHTESNASAEHLSSEQNTSLWITNLPPDTTYHELLGQIRNIGRIWCCFINGPDGWKHTTAAAKVVFFQPSAARCLLQHAAAADGGLHIRGFRAKAAQNRIKTGETKARGDDSRVLIVTGEDHFVNEAALTEWFAQRFVFQVDEVRELIKCQGRAVVEFRFGSYRCQAQMGKLSLEMDSPAGFKRAEFGEDPCEVGETDSSLDIARKRISECWDPSSLTRRIGERRWH